MEIGPARRWLTTTTVVVVAALALASCSDDDSDGEAVSPPRTDQTTPGGEDAAERVTLTGGETVLVLDETTATVLETGGIELKASGEARRAGDGFAFPIRGGEVQSDTLAGEIGHGGGLRFSAAGRDLVARDFIVDGRDEALTAEVGGSRVQLLSLELDGLKTTVSEGALLASGIDAVLGADAAELLNERLGVDVLSGGLAIGELSVRGER